MEDVMSLMKEMQLKMNSMETGESAWGQVRAREGRLGKCYNYYRRTDSGDRAGGVSPHRTKSREIDELLKISLFLLQK